MTSTHPSLQSHSHQTLLHSILLTFSLVFLPRSNYQYPIDNAPIQTKSADKPQAGWLNPITLDPANTLLWWTVGAVVIGVFRAGWARRQFALNQEKSAQTSNKAASSQETKERGKALFTRLLQALAACVILSPVTTILLVLLGAPLTSDSTKASYSPSPLTPLLALLVNVLVFFIPFYVVGIPLPMIQEFIASLPGLSSIEALSSPQDQSSKSKGLSEGDQVLCEWSRLFVQLSTSTPLDRAIVFPALGSLLGAWAGVIPIALDWERPWQTYPLTPAAGAVLGFIGGAVLALQNHAWLWLKSLSESIPASKQSSASTKEVKSDDRAKWVMLDADNHTGKEKTPRKRKGKSKTKTSHQDVSR